MIYDTPRLRAKAAGLTRYEGLPCRHGHGTTRYVYNQECLVCRRLRKQEYKKRKRLHDKVGRPKKVNRELTEQELDLKRQRMRIASKKYSSDPKNKAKLTAKRAKRRCSKLQRTPKWVGVEETRQIKALYQQAKELQKATGQVWHVDHIIPLLGKEVSGLHVISNLQILLASENMKKGNKLINT